MRLYRIISLLFFAAACACNTKQRQNPYEKASQEAWLKQIISEMAANNTIESDYIGVAGSPSTQLWRCKALKEIASDDKLIALTDHKNPVVKYYSFRALVIRNSNKVFEILLKNMNDTSTRVHTLNGCIGFTETLRYNLIGLVYSKGSDSKEFHLNDRQRQIVDSILEKYPDPILRAVKL